MASSCKETVEKIPDNNRWPRKQEKNDRRRERLRQKHSLSRKDEGNWNPVSSSVIYCTS